MKLGNYAHVSLSVHTLRESLPFYAALGFSRLFGNDDPQPWVLLSDGVLNVHLYESSFPSPALHYFSSSMNAKVAELGQQALKLQEQISKDGTRRQHTLVDPNDMHVVLMHHDDADMPRPEGSSRSVLGTFAEISISTNNLAGSAAFWKSIGFTERHASANPYPWTIMSDDILTVGLHQTSTFNAPALTYLTMSVSQQIAQLKSIGVALTHEIKGRSGELAGAILNAPDGQLFFLLQGKP
ncbi:MAG: hypothetical protein HY961_06005 [Ignavibacteriae bacterium]|nr:hypothetical protein [Ignavibacteriota bacterium]